MKENVNKTFYTVETDYGTYGDIVISTSRYRYDNSLAVILDSESEGPFATITVCIDHDMELKEDEAFVDTNNCPWAEEFIVKNGLGKPTGDVGYSGFCEYPLYKFNLDKLNK